MPKEAVELHCINNLFLKFEANETAFVQRLSLKTAFLNYFAKKNSKATVNYK